MKRKSISKIRNKKSSAPSPLGIRDLASDLLYESPFRSMNKAQAQVHFEHMLGDARASRFEAGAEYRQPEPLGPIRVEYDEDGVPSYPED